MTTSTNAGSNCTSGAVLPELPEPAPPGPLSAAEDAELDALLARREAARAAAAAALPAAGRTDRMAGPETSQLPGTPGGG